MIDSLRNRQLPRETDYQIISGVMAQQNFQVALQHHQAGRLHQAELIYRQILQQEPNHPDALHLLGAIARQAGKKELAVDLIDRAINAKPTEPVYYNSKGLVLRDLGKLDEAIACYREAIGLGSEYSEAYYNLANILQIQGKLDEAIVNYKYALAFNPGDAEAQNNMGNALLSQGKLSEAVASYRGALAIRPNHVEALGNLGNALLAQGNSDDAITAYQHALKLKPDYAKLHYKLALALERQGRPDEAISSYQRAVLHQPDFIEAYNSLGIALREQGQVDEAVACFRKVLLHKPEDARVYNNLGMALWAQGKLDESIASFRRALSINPEYADALFNLGFTYWGHYQEDAAIACYQKAISIDPGYVKAYNNLGLAYQAHGKLDEARETFSRALEVNPSYGQAYSNLLFLHAYHGILKPEAYLSLARGWELACVPVQERDAARNRRFHRSPLAGRRMKIGYVSGDFRQHAVSYFIEQLIDNHDRTRVELFAYSTVNTRDVITERIQAKAEHWIPVSGLSDSAMRERIEADGIDVLIDLSGHTEHDRMGVFARRAAPVQVHYLGYFASTGLSEMDYLIGDAVLIPPQMDKHFTEQIWRLPRIRATYDGKAAPEPDWRPDPTGIIRIGGFSNLGKLTPETFSLWAKVLHALPQGHLLLKTKELSNAGNRQRILDSMVMHGISPDRIELHDRSDTPDWLDHMAYYDRLDIVLDPIGAHGGYTTSCDALWMGAPVITLEGDCMASRMTASILSAIGHPEWISHSESDYVDKVVTLATDVEQRKALRPVQRGLMIGSSLCDAKDLAMKLEDAYFEMFSLKTLVADEKS